MRTSDDEAAVERIARVLCCPHGCSAEIMGRRERGGYRCAADALDCAADALEVREHVDIVLDAMCAGPLPRAVREAVLRQELAEQQAAHAQAEPGSPDWIATSARAAWLEDRIETLAELAREGESDG
jgi:hypothetical protein